MEEDEVTSPPFWLQPNGRRRRRGGSSSLFSSSSALIVLILLSLVTAFTFLFVVVPSFVSFTSQIFRPHLVRKSWDSLNLVLVLFAIICGFLSRSSSDSDGGGVGATKRTDSQKSNPTTPYKWYYEEDDLDRRRGLDSGRADEYGFGSSFHRVRSSSSYPDLRVVDSSWSYSNDEPRRFYDDTRLDMGRTMGSDPVHLRRSWREDVEEEKFENKYVIADYARGPKNSNDNQNETVEDAKVSDTPPPAPSSPPPRTRTRSRTADGKRKAKRVYESVGQCKPRDEHINEDGFGVGKIVKSAALSNLSPLPPPPPPPPPPPNRLSEKKSGKKRGGSASATKEFLTSLRMKKKKQRQKSTESFESLLSSQPPQPTPLLRLPPPSPPPLPPPPSVFHSLFSKKGKKKLLSVPRPPPSPSSQPIRASRGATSRRAQWNAGSLGHAAGALDDGVNAGSQSPLIPIPPPPPPPPFKVPAWKFLVRGDYVRIKSADASSSNSSYLDGNDGDISSSDVSQTQSPLPSPSSSPSPSPSPMFCPSPDVDSKADHFIARFRAGLQLEKMNSLKLKQQQVGTMSTSARRSNLGLGPEPYSGPQT